MASIKTAISVEKPLFKEIDRVAKKMKISRSRLFTLAAREFLQRYEGQELLDALNAVYDGMPDPEEERQRLLMKAKYAHLSEDEW